MVQEPFFLDGAISEKVRLFEEGGLDSVWRLENFERGLRALNESTKM